MAGVQRLYPNGCRLSCDAAQRPLTFGWSVGSERIASGAHGGSNATGEHFKEACHINKSLTALGRVTTELLKSQKNNGTGHVPYRDSKLTFLLQVPGKDGIMAAQPGCVEVLVLVRAPCLRVACKALPGADLGRANAPAPVCNVL